ncbi:MAG: hypothetical protein U0514_01465 [Candidatus Andersenbacteria bacterium]
MATKKENAPAPDPREDEGILPPSQPGEQPAQLETEEATNRQTVSAERWKAGHPQIDDETLNGVLERAIETHAAMNELDAAHVDRAALDQNIVDFADMYANAELTRREFERQVEKLPPAEQVLARNLQVHSIGFADTIKRDKLHFAQMISEHATATGEPEHYRRAVYFGSADDVELAILAGARDITLVDPVLDDRHVAALVDRIKSSYDRQARYDTTHRTLHFKHGGVDYVVTLLPETLSQFKERTEKFDLVMLFNRAPSMKGSDAKQAVRDGGLYFDNREPWPNESAVEPIDEAEGSDQVEPLSPSMRAVQPIELSGSTLLTERSLIHEVIEPPLIPAVEELFDKNIETLMSTANAKNVGNEGAITIGWDHLSQANRAIVRRIGVVEEVGQRIEASLRVPISADDTVASVSKRMLALTSQLQEQPATWIPRYTLEQMAAVFRLPPGDPRATPEGFEQMGFLYDPARHVFFRSEELKRKFDESEKKFGRSGL